jgi:AmmeMemoRadiSam system protein B
MFYPAGERDCRRQAQQMLADASEEAPPGQWFGALVPHAGWTCSGQVAAEAIACLKKVCPNPELVVIFGAVHTVSDLSYGALDSHSCWNVPSGQIAVDEAAQEALLADDSVFRVQDLAHAREHAIEVEIPLVQAAWSEAAILPIEVPPIPKAGEIGRAAARRLRGRSAIYLASSDLTHYGPNYGFTPSGVGLAGVRWAMDNDRRLLRKILDLNEAEALSESESRFSACGGGAIAAVIGACKELGANKTHLLKHTNSYEVLSPKYPGESANSVGYAAVLLGK